MVHMYMSICDAVAAGLLGYNIPLVDHAQHQSCGGPGHPHTTSSLWHVARLLLHFAHDTYTMEWFRGASVGTKLVTGISTHTHKQSDSSLSRALFCGFAGVHVQLLPLPQRRGFFGVPTAPASMIVSTLCQQSRSPALRWLARRSHLR